MYFYYLESTKVIYFWQHWPYIIEDIIFAIWRSITDYTPCPKKCPPFIFHITPLPKINQFLKWFLVCEMLTKFDINSLYIFPPYLYTVTTLPWEIQKSHFSTVLFMQTSDYLRYLIRNKLQLLYCSLSVYLGLLLFTASYYLHSPSLWSVFTSLWSVIFKATNAKLPTITGSFQSHQHLEELQSDITVFTALHGMQSRYSDGNSVCPSVCLSNVCIVTKWKKAMFWFLYHMKEHLS